MSTETITKRTCDACGANIGQDTGVWIQGLYRSVHHLGYNSILPEPPTADLCMDCSRAVEVVLRERGMDGSRWHLLEKHA